MSNYRSIASTVFAASAILVSTAAFAHPKLLSSTPADQAEVTAPTKIELKFSETLTTQFSGANLVMTEMPGMSGHNPMKVAAKVSAGDDAKTMVITPAQPLTTGTYKVDWRAVSSDTHPMTGNFSFKVK
jgi:methionine-rich copper-binding protein CopC